MAALNHSLHIQLPLLVSSSFAFSLSSLLPPSFHLFFFARPFPRPLPGSSAPILHCSRFKVNYCMIYWLGATRLPNIYCSSRSLFGEVGHSSLLLTRKYFQVFPHNYWKSSRANSFFFSVAGRWEQFQVKGNMTLQQYVLLFLFSRFNFTCCCVSLCPR